MKLCLDAVISVGLDDTRCEVGIPVRRDDETKVHETSDNDLVVLEDASDVAEGDLALNGRAALVRAQASRDKGLLIFAEPLHIFWEVGQPEEEEDTNDDSEEAFEDKDPAPAGIAADTAHLSDRCSKKTAECAGEGGAVEEEGVATLSFVATIPHADKVER